MMTVYEEFMVKSAERVELELRLIAARQAETNAHLKELIIMCEYEPDEEAE